MDGKCSPDRRKTVEQEDKKKKPGNKRGGCSSKTTDNPEVDTAMGAKKKKSLDRNRADSSSAGT